MPHPAAADMRTSYARSGLRKKLESPGTGPRRSPFQLAELTLSDFYWDAAYDLVGVACYFYLRPYVD
jgi:hypothetical protein